MLAHTQNPLPWGRSLSLPGPRLLIWEKRCCHLPGPGTFPAAEVCLRPCPQPRAVKAPFIKTENPWQPAGSQAVELRPASCLEVPQRPQPSSLQSSPRTSPRAPPQTPATTAPPPSPPITRARIRILQKRTGGRYLLLSSLGGKRHSGLTQGPTAVLPPRLWKSPFACTLRRGGRNARHYLSRAPVGAGDFAQQFS